MAKRFNKSEFKKAARKRVMQDLEVAQEPMDLEAKVGEKFEERNASRKQLEKIKKKRVRTITG